MGDTDGLFVAATETGRRVPCPGGTARMPDGEPAVTTATWTAVKSHVVDAFEALNPYDRESVPGSILKLEDENFDPATGEQREIHCLSIAAKRYALFTRGPDGLPTIVGPARDPKRSRHGLGHLLRPTPPEVDWITEWWTHLLCVELGIPHADPAWFDGIAVGALTVTTPHEDRLWATYHNGRRYQARVRPWNFAMTAHPARVRRSTTGPSSLIAPRADDPCGRLAANWLDRHNPTRLPYQVSTCTTADHVDGQVPVLGYRDYFIEYRAHPEYKARTVDGSNCHPWSRGPLAPAIVRASHLVRISKETTIGASDDLGANVALSLEIIYRRPSCPVCGCLLGGTKTKNAHHDR